MLEVERFTKRYGDFTAVKDLSFAVGGGRDPGARRAERGGQDHDAASARRDPPAQRAGGSGRGPRHRHGAASREARPRVRARHADALRAAHGGGAPALHGPGLRRRRSPKPGSTSCCAELELAEKRDALGNTLSRGMKQKLAFAMRLPARSARCSCSTSRSTGLDPKAIRSVRDAIRQRADDGAAVIVSSHLLDLVERLCDRILVLHRGGSSPWARSPRSGGRRRPTRARAWKRCSSRSRSERRTTEDGDMIHRALVYLLLMRLKNAALGTPQAAGPADRPADPRRGFRDRWRSAGRRVSDMSQVDRAVVLVVLLSLYYLFSLFGGTGEPGPMFPQSDVDFVFPAPFRRRDVLVYHLLRHYLQMVLLRPLLRRLSWRSPTAQSGIDVRRHRALSGDLHARADGDDADRVDAEREGVRAAPAGCRALVFVVLFAVGVILAVGGLTGVGGVEQLLRTWIETDLARWVLYPAVAVGDLAFAGTTAAVLTAAWSARNASSGRSCSCWRSPSTSWRRRRPGSSESSGRRERRRTCGGPSARRRGRSFGERVPWHG